MKTFTGPPVTRNSILVQLYNCANKLQKPSKNLFSNFRKVFLYLLGNIWVHKYVIHVVFFLFAQAIKQFHLIQMRYRKHLIEY